ncbi:hypothetical protein [Candidatus Cardinium hertigii]|uniref:Uncharacterized protein n=1 Tax=Candidatus Cardinium hertigii TaxID=247481 RepID=A0A2Z3L7Q8_9BACT|nr:hypothetical protein [Candidatus Cardinium hertigii]AWN81587.1 hypothetical protein DK880_00255 [Candidatus Cardinium hertigii]
MLVAISLGGCSRSHVGVKKDVKDQVESQYANQLDGQGADQSDVEDQVEGQCANQLDSQGAGQSGIEDQSVKKEEETQFIGAAMYHAVNLGGAFASWGMCLGANVVIDNFLKNRHHQIDDIAAPIFWGLMGGFIVGNLAGIALGVMKEIYKKRNNIEAVEYLNNTLELLSDY